MAKPRRIIRLLLILFLVTTTPLLLSAQSGSVEEQRRRVNQYKQDLEIAKREVANLKKEKSSASRRIEALYDQLRTRNRYIEEIEAERQLVIKEINAADFALDSLGGELNINREVYAEVVRTAYRNYRQNNNINYLFSSSDLSDATRRMADLQHIADERKALAETIVGQTEEYNKQRDILDVRRRELDSITSVLEDEQAALRADRAEAQREYNNLSSKEKSAVKRQREQQQRLDKAVEELSRLTRGNTVGASFSASTKSLNLPVNNGALSKSSGSTATITGSRGSAVRSIYEGLVMRVDRNDITNHYSVFIAYGEYLSVYTNVSNVTVKAGDKVKQDQQIGTIGHGVDHNGKEYSYIQFAIHDTRKGKQLSVTDFFKKK